MVGSLQSLLPPRQHFFFQIRQDLCILWQSLCFVWKADELLHTQITPVTCLLLMNFRGQRNTVFHLKYKPVSNICYPIKATDMWGFFNHALCAQDIKKSPVSLQWDLAILFKSLHTSHHLFVLSLSTVLYVN